MKRKLLIFLILIFMGVLPAFASINVSLPKVSNVYQGVDLEQGATYRVTISYTNDTPNPVNIAAMKFYLKYDQNNLSLYNTQKNSAVDLGYYFKHSNKYDFSYKQIDEGQGFIQLGMILKGGQTELTVAPNALEDIITLTFHVNKAAAAGPNKKLVWWWDAFGQGQNITDYVFVKEAGDADRSGNIPANSFYNVATGAPPSTFDGIDTNGLYDGDGVNNKPGIGNTVTITWSTNAGAASDSNGGAETLYQDGKLRYHVYRDNVKKASFTLGAPSPNYIFRDGAGTGAPTTGLNDGTEYTYKITAVDNTDADTIPNDLDYSSTTPNEKDTSTQKIKPTDTTAPGNVTGLSVAPGNQEVTLNWTNPGDADLGGVIIIQRESAPVGAVSLTGADGNTFAHGEIVAENADLGDGKVIFAGNALNNHGDTSKQGAVANTYVAGGLTNGVTYHYKVITYDMAVGLIGNNDLVQMGRNYSSGAAASGAPGVAPGAIKDFYAISSTEAGKIVLKWTNPSEAWFGGAVFWASDDPAAKWTAIPADKNNWATALSNNEMAALAVYEPDNPGTVLDQDDSIVLENVDKNKVYFFKAFAFNKTPQPYDASNEPNFLSHEYSGPAQASAVPSAGGIPMTFGYPFIGPDYDKYMISMPYNLDYASGQEIADDINTQIGANVSNPKDVNNPGVFELTRLNPATQQFESVVYDVNFGWITPNSFKVVSGEGYIIYTGGQIKDFTPKAQ